MVSLERNIRFNKNKEEFLFHPRKFIFRNGKKLFSSQSAQNIFNFRENKSISYNDNFLENEAQKVSLNENTYYNKNKFPPIYFYRKIECPYKYSITSIPEYLLKTNEERNFKEKMEKYIKEENTKKKFKEFLIIKQRDSRVKDRYKPNGLDTQTILKYRPDIYLDSIKFNRDTYSCMDNDNQNRTVNLINSIEEMKDEENDNKIRNGEIKKREIENKLFDIDNKKTIEKELINKSEERYNQNRINTSIHTNNKNQTDRIPNKKFGIKMNSFSSVSYNILSPMCKGLNNRFLSSSELNKDNLYNESPAFHRVKKISEFVELPGFKFRSNLDSFNENKKNKIRNFKLKGSSSTDQKNVFRLNRDLLSNLI